MKNELRAVTPERMGKVIKISSTITASVYLLISYVGIVSFGSAMPELLTDVKIEFDPTAKLCFTIGKIWLAIRFPTTLIPLREQIYITIFKTTDVSSFWHSIITFVALFSAGFIAIIYPYFYDIVSIVGTLFVFIGFIMPGLIYIKMSNDKLLYWKNILMIIFIIIASICGLLSAILTFLCRLNLIQI